MDSIVLNIVNRLLHFFANGEVIKRPWEGIEN